MIFLVGLVTMILMRTLRKDYARWGKVVANNNFCKTSYSCKVSQDFICNNICNLIRYSKEEDIDDMERDLGDEYGWKQVSIA